MDIATKVRMAEAYIKISEAELSKRLGKSPQAFGQRLKTGKFTTEEMEQIATALGGRWRAEFVFEDGTVI